MVCPAYTGDEWSSKLNNPLYIPIFRQDPKLVALLGYRVEECKMRYEPAISSGSDFRRFGQQTFPPRTIRIIK